MNPYENAGLNYYHQTYGNAPSAPSWANQKAPVNLNQFNDPVSLHNAFKSGQINKQQFQTRLFQIQSPKAGNSNLSFSQNLMQTIKGLPSVTAQAGVSAGKAMVNPAVDIATGQGGKFAHDTAQLSRDMTGGVPNYLLNAAINNPIKELSAANSGNKVAARNANIKTNENLGLGDQGTRLGHALIKAGVLGGSAILGGRTPGLFLRGAQKVYGAKAALAEAKNTVTNVATHNLLQGAQSSELGQAITRAKTIQEAMPNAPKSAFDNHIVESPTLSEGKPTVAPAKGVTPVEGATTTAGKGTTAIDALKTKPDLNESGAVSLPTTNDYVKQQIKLQDAARKAGSRNPIIAAKSEAKQKLVDSFAPIEDTLNKSGAKVAPENNIKYQIDRAIRGDTIGAQYIKDNGLAKIIQSAPNTKELDQYLIAKHAADLEKNGIQTGRNLPADQQLVKDLGPKYEAHAQAVKEYSNNLLDTATNYGLVSKDLAAHLKEKYPNYVPVNRIFSDSELPNIPKGTGKGMASLGSQNVVQKIKGSTRQIESPLSNLVNKSIDVVKQGERNKAAQILTGYKDLPGNPFQLRELGKEEVVGNKPVISVLDKGVQRRFETTPEIASAAKSLSKEQLGLIGKILSVPTRVLRLGATGLNPAFALSNVAKDTVSAFINSSHALRASPANPKVFMQSLIAAANHGSKQYGELVREGAGGTSFDIARNAPKQNLKAIRAERNLPSKIAYTVTRPSQLLRAAENTIGRSEEFNRAIQYFGNKDAFANKGYSAAQSKTLAANAARNNTVNFARAGDYGRVLNSTLPYFNAGIQGSRTLLRNLKDRPLQTGTKLAVSTLFPVAVLTAWNTSDPQRKAAYDDIKDYEKQGNLVIVPPHPVKDPKTGQWNVIKIPLSQEIANLASVVRNGTEAAVKDGKLNIAEMLGNTAGTVTSLNSQSPRQLANQLTPQAIKPGIESLVNQNLYTGNKIVPDSQRNLPAKDQTGPGTSKLATKLGQATNLSPRNIDNAISTGTGGLGKNIVHGKSLSSQISARFNGAQGNSPYDVANTRFNSLKDQLINLPGYKSMSSQDKAKALNRLQSAVNGALAPLPGKKLSARQRAIVNKNPDLVSYLKSKR